MNQLFDKFGLFEPPVFVLCNPDKSELFSLGGIDNRKYKPRYNSLGEISFTAYAIIDGVVTDYYDSILYRRLVYLVDIGYFMITEISESNDGIIKQKEVVAKSIDAELSLKKITAFTGTYQFYDLITPSGTLLGYILTLLPGWTIGTIDTSLTTLFRTFNVSDKTVYDFMMTEVEDAFQCVFVFNIMTKTISAYTYATAITVTDIYLSYENLIEKIDVKELTDELSTSLTVRGAGNLSISTVNPLGTDKIYNFDYYKTTSWMSQGLIDAIDAWEARIAAKQVDYANLLTLLRENNEILITLTAELVDLNSAMASLVGVQGARIQQGIDYSDINVQISAKQAEIDSKQAEIDSANTTIGVSTGGIYPPGTIMAQLTDINTYVSFAANFTTLQQTELSAFIMGNTYNNENFVQTDIMTQAEIQDQAQELYNQAQTVLAKVSVPRYEFSVDAINFVFLQDFTTFINQLQLGCSVTLELKEDTWIYPVLLGIDLNYDDPTDFTLTFGNRLRLDDSSYEFSDLFGQTVNKGITTSFNSEQWGNWNTNYRDDVSTFITSALDASKNAVISGSTQNVLINQNGVRIRSLISGSTTYSPEQIWLNNGIIAFTQNNWDTASLALGKISTISGSAYGIVAETVVGRLIAGNNLTITNDSNTFTVNAGGATLTNATMTINTTSGNTKILLDPTNGIKIQGKTGGVWSDRFYADGAGNLTFKGALSGATGTFSGTLSAATISGGTITGASINGGTISGTTGTFSGNIYADRIFGTISYSQLTDIPANKITSGTMSGNRIYGGVLSWAGGTFDMNAYGQATLGLTNPFIVNIGGTRMLYIYSGGLHTYGQIEGYGLQIYGTGYFSSNVQSDGEITAGTLHSTGYVNGYTYQSRGYTGITSSVYYYNGSSIRVMSFVGGICVAT